MNRDLMVVTGYLLVALVAIVQIQAGFVAATLLLFGVPGGYLAWRRPKLTAKTTLMSLVLGIPFGIMIDYLAHKDGAWFVPDSAIRILNGLVPVENVVWVVVWTFFIITFWETFLDRDRRKNTVSWNLKYLVGLVCGTGSVFLGFYIWAREVLQVPYFYMTMGVVMVVIPMMLVYLARPKLRKKAVVLGLYFGVFSLAVEFVSLTLGHWVFPGDNYVYVINFFEHRLPVEEIVFWCGLGAPGLIAWYEGFADDLK